jgi:HAD superfamily hydrolase (TIGR01509 family)
MGPAVGIKAVIFDLDGTIVENAYDWPKIREELGTGDTSVLQYLDGLDDPERTHKWAILERHEFEQTAGSVLRQGIPGLLAFLSASDVKAALVTNNSRSNTDYLLAKFSLAFDMVLTREAGLWKPSGAPFSEVLRGLGVGADESCVVGDTRFDILAAVDAGIKRIFLLTDAPERFAGFPVEVFTSAGSLEKRLRELV